MIVYVGTNDLAHEQSELTKKDFNGLLSFLSTCGKSVFISGPIPTVFLGVGHFSRLLSRLPATLVLLTILTFWGVQPVRRDGLQPSMLGSRMLAVQSVQPTS